MKFSGNRGISAEVACKKLTIQYRDLSNKEFNNNDTRGPKSVSAFLVKLSELAPRLVNRQMTLLVKQLDSEVLYYIVQIKRTMLMCAGIHPSVCGHRGLR